ncbi:MAG: GldG family protein [Oscillospiraceae bacterium]|nr:GldG family protein [Oscillospiraceae bacterium]
MKFLNSRKFKIGAYGATVTAVILLIVVALNYVSILLTDRKDAFVDLTADKAFELSEEARSIFAKLEDPIRVTVLFGEEEYETLNPYCAQVVYILDQAEKENDKVTVCYIDPLENPEIAASYPGIACTQGDMVMENTETGRFYEVPFSDLFFFTSSGSISGSKAEAVIASRMMSMTSGESYNISFTKGHNEDTTEEFTSLLGLNNYTVSTVSLVTEDIDEDTLCLVIVAPKVDFSTEEILKLENFMRNGGNYGKSILYFTSIEQPDVPNLTAFLSNYGLAVTTEVIGETDSRYTFGDSQFYALSGYLEENYSAKALSAGLPSISPYTRPVSILFVNSSNVRTAPLMSFSPTSMAIDMVDSSKYRSGSDGDLYSAAVAEQYEYVSGEGERISRLVVFGTSYFVNDTMLSTESLGNAEYMVGVMAQLAPNETSVEIAAKSILGGYMSISSRTASILGIVFIAVVPLIIIALGIFVYYRRRNK